MTRKLTSFSLLSGILLAGSSFVYAQEESDTAKRLEAATTTFTEIMAVPDKGIPQDLLAKASCAVIVPGVKQAAFIVGAKYGRGFLTCKKPNGDWSAPAAMRVEGGGVGFQIGGSETDVVMLVMNESGADRLMSTEFKLGGQGQVAAGPVGRTAAAETDAGFRAEILSWSRSRGAFAGVSLEGSTLREDKGANKELYGSELSTKEIVRGDVKPTAAAVPLLTSLQKYSSSASREATPAPTKDTK
jgi:lipid-binding SYLF domain-containing protein